MTTLHTFAVMLSIRHVGQQQLGQRELAANANLMRKILKSTPLSGLKGANVAAAAAAAVAVVLQLQQVAASGNVQMTSFKFMHDPHSSSSSISCQQQQRCSVVVVELMFY